MGRDDLFVVYKDMPPERHDAFTAPADDAPKIEDPITDSSIRDSLTFKEKFTLRHFILAHAHYISGSCNPWNTRFDLLRWKNLDPILRKVINTKIRLKEVHPGRIRIRNIAAETGHADAFIIGRHNIVLEGYLHIAPNGDWHFHGHIGSDQGMDMFNFNASDRVFWKEMAVTAIRFEGKVLGGKPFPLFIHGTMKKTLSGTMYE